MKEEERKKSNKVKSRNRRDKFRAEEGKKNINIKQRNIKATDEIDEVETIINKEKINKKRIMLEEIFAREDYKPMKFKDLVAFLQVPRNEKYQLRELVEEFVTSGKMIVNGSGQFQLPGDGVKTGIYAGTTRGFGFVTVEGEEQDIFIPEVSTKGALHGDRVMITISEEQSGKRREGTVINILERSITNVVGTFVKSKNFGFVLADNQKIGKDIFIPKEHTKGAVNGHKVVVQITNYGNGSQNPEGKVIEILGHINDPGVDIMSIIRAYELPVEFPQELMNFLDNIPDEVDPKDMEGRRDIRHLQMVTIDGEDAKDLDDAITISKENDIYHLGVHIADVSNYVREGSPLDREALDRGTSVYLVDRVIPMLPHKLSNGICSLNEGADRLALSCFMDFDSKGHIMSHSVEETVVRVDRRMTYTSVAKIVEDKDPEEIKKYEELVPMFNLMMELAQILRDNRSQRGSIDFDFPESKIIVDDNGKIVDIKAYERNKATKIIEEFMLAANETVAEDFFWQELPFVYRTHDLPNEEKIIQLGIFINNLGYSIHIGNDDIHPKELQKLINKIEGTPEEALISRLTLRSMKQAKYTVDNTGHFGLAAKYYCHFTSPIRRYPDLQIHRIIKENVKGKLNEKRQIHYDKILPEVAFHSSKTERRAEEAERDVEKMKKVEYMSDFIGETFFGVISGLTSWGMFVELPNTVEGMIRVSDMEDDYYIYDEEHFQMVGEHTKKAYKLGQVIKIEVVATDKLQRTIDFAIAEEE
ncbi:MAG: ribonuclease R [Clostridiales bacterium]|nr:ribonuclease R [Clostridiales bacterium]